MTRPTSITLSCLRRASGLLLAGLATAGPMMLASPSAATEITLPPETVRLAPSTMKGFPVAEAYCVLCHSADYIRSQPPLSRAAWEADVLKMKKTFGAPIPDDQLELIVDYLVNTYGARKLPPSTRSSPAAK